MNKILLKKVKESLLSVLPIFCAIVIINFLMPEPASIIELVSFFIGATLLTLGMVLYSLGSETALEPIGESIGNTMTKSKKILIILILGFVVGFIVTIAEPDLMVLGEQLGSIKWTLIITVAVGVGIFLLLALLRIVKHINLNMSLIVLYGLLFALALFADGKYVTLSFDSGGVTTGPITVPFILAIGIGVASVFGSKSKAEDSFGLLAICSIGPIAAVLLLSIIFKPQIDSSVSYAELNSFMDVFSLYGANAGKSFLEVLIALLPISVFFIILNIFFIKTPKKRLTRIIIGLLYTYVGLSIFLLGANAGFISMGHSLGEKMASLDFNLVIVPIGMVLGALIVLAEPAVHVLSKQVESVSNGAIKKPMLIISLCLSMSLAIGLSMLRVLYNISIWYFIVPGYAIALILSFFVPKVYTAIAFDSGGVVSGPMTTTFLLPFAIGAATVVSGAENVLTSAYGIVALVAMMPLIAIQILGFIASRKQKKSATAAIPTKAVLSESAVIELDYSRANLEEKV